MNKIDFDTAGSEAYQFRRFSGIQARKFSVRPHDAEPDSPALERFLGAVAALSVIAYFIWCAAKYVVSCHV